MFLENARVGKGDDSALLSEVPKPNDRVSAALSLIPDLTSIDYWSKR